PGGFSSSLPAGSTTGKGATWTWQTLQPVYSFTGTTCANDICFTRTTPADNRSFGPFGVPGRSLSASGVTTTSASLTSSLITFFSPPTTLFTFTSNVEELAPGVFRYTADVTNLTGNQIHFDLDPGPYGCNSRCGNGVREGNEVCDGADLNGASCGSLGYASGTLACKADCTG